MQENVLGAPAEGFGQDVTFTIRQDPRDIPQARQGLDISRTRNGIRGGPQRQRPLQLEPVAAPRPDPTMEILMKVVDPIVRANIQERRAQAVTQGMTAAAAGMAIQEVADTQPWYSKLFGDSDVVEGARQYTASARSAKLAADIEARMPELAKLTPAEAAGVYHSTVKGALTGDEAADNAIMAGAMRVMPSVMHRQVREHVAYTQAAALQAQSDNFQAVAGRLQSVRSGAPGVQTPEDYAVLSQAMVDAAKPAAGQNMDEWAKRTTKDVLALADNGNLAAVYALEDAKLLNHLPGDAQLRLRAATQQAESRVRANAPIELHQRLQNILVRTQFPPEVGGLRANQVADLVNVVNADFMRITGSRAPLLDTAGILRGEGNALEVAMRERVAAMRDAAKAAPVGPAKKALEQNAAGVAILSSTYDPSLPTAAYIRQWQDWAGGKGAAGALGNRTYVAALAASANNKDIPDDPLQKQAVRTTLTTAVNAGDPRQALGALLHFGKLESVSPGTGRHYAGEFATQLHSMWRQYGPQLQDLVSDPKAGAVEKADAYVRFMADFQDGLLRPRARLGSPVSGVEDTKVVEKATSDLRDSPGMFRSGVNAITESGRAVNYELAPLTKASLKRFQEDNGSLIAAAAKAGEDPAVRARELFLAEKNGPFRTVAGHRFAQPANAPELHTWLGADERGASAVPAQFVPMLFAQKIESLVEDPKDAIVYQTTGGAVPEFFVIGPGKKTGLLTESDVRIHWFNAADLVTAWHTRKTPTAPDPRMKSGASLSGMPGLPR